jgi:predicted glycoside hydrolase/deacetylase ChbG (UPF0249 family)
MLKCLAELEGGASEVCCHPGYPDGLTTMYREERLREIDTLCDPTIREEIERQRIRLCSFADLGSAVEIDDT